MSDEMELADYRADWDGEGADPPLPALIAAVPRWREILEGRGFLLPPTIYPIADGTVMVECASADGKEVSLNIREPNKAEALFKRKDTEPVFEIITISESPA